MVDVTPGDSGANKGFWRYQLRDRKTKRFIPMGGGVIFETTIPGVDGIVRARGFFRGMIDLETAKIEVMDNSEIPRGIYYVKSEFIEEDTSRARLSEDFLQEKLGTPDKPTAPEAPPPLKQSISGDEAIKIRLKSVAKALKAEGRFPIPRQFNNSHVGKDSDTAKGAKLDYKKVFDSEPALQEKYGSAENLWTKVVEYAVDDRSQSPNTLAEIPEDMKEINRAYAKHVLGIEPDGLITFYRNAINGKDTPEESAVGYASIDKTMAYDYNPQMGNAGANGRYEIDVKPDELYGMIGYSKIEDEYGVVLGREMTNIPGRVRRVGDLEKSKTAPWLEKSSDVFRENAGSSPFRYFTIMSQYEMHPVESFGADINEFFSKYNLSAADIKSKYDELYGEGAYDEYKASGNTVSFQNIKSLFIDLGDGKVGLDGVKLSLMSNQHQNAAEYKNDRFDNTMKMLSVFQELTGQYFMTHKTRDYTPPVQDEVLEVKDSAEIVLPPKPREAPIPEGHVRLFHYTNETAVENIRKNGLQAQKDGAAVADDNVSLVWATENAPVNGDQMFRERPIVEFHVPEEVWDKGAGLGFERTAMAGPISAENIVAVHEPWHFYARDALEEITPEDIISRFDRDLSALDGQPDMKAGIEAAVKIAKQALGQKQDYLDSEAEAEAEANISRDYVDSVIKYTDGSGMYSLVNEYLRNGPQDWMGSEKITDAMQIIEDLESIFDELPPIETEMEVYRGFTENALDQLSSIEEGDTITDLGFVSTSADRSVAEGFAMEDGIVAKINLPVGAKAFSPVTYRTGDSSDDPEKEMLLPPGTTLKLVSKSDKEYVFDLVLSEEPETMYDEFFDAGMIDLRSLRKSSPQISPYDLELFSEKQLKALEWYGQAGHRAINKILRSGEPISAEDQAEIDAIDEAIEENGDVYNAGRVFRGDDPSSSSEYYKFLRGLTEGKVVNFPGYFSTSNDATIAFSEFGPGTRENNEDASQGNGSSAFFWTIDIPEGGRAMGMPEGVGYGSGVESEVLLPRNTKMKIISIKKVEQVDEEDGPLGEFNYFIHAEQLVSAEVETTQDTPETSDSTATTYEEVDYYDVPALEPKDALESVALSYYTGETQSKPDGHRNMNVYLRTGQHHEDVDTPYAQSYVEEKIELLKNIVNSQVIDKNIKVFRYQGELTEGLDQVGGVWVSDGFLSTSTATTRRGDQVVETEFSELPIQIEINIPAGSRGGAVGTGLGEDEGEVLLPPGSKFIVEKTEKTDDKTKVSLLLVSQEEEEGPGKDIQNRKAKEIASEFENPAGIALFTRVGPQLGSNEGGTFEGLGGTKYYVKTPKSEDHLKNELLASALYRLAGVGVAHMKHGLYRDKTDRLFSEIIPGETLAETKLPSGSIHLKIQENFAIDAWLANWDVVGSADDNIIVDADGNPYRIDLGGALLFRARGEQKGEAFGDEVTEIATLRDPSKNPNSAEIFGYMSFDDMKKSASKLLDISPEDIDILVDSIFYGDMAIELKEKLKARRNNILEKFELIESNEQKDSSVAYSEVDFSEIPELNVSTIDETEALNYYTGDGKYVQDVGHHKVNTWLREGEWYWTVRTEEEQKVVLNNLDLLQKTVNSSIIDKDIKVLRYQSSIPEGLGEVGEIWTSDGFLSTSAATSDGKEVVTAFTYSPVLIEINIPKGSRGGAVPGSVEAEVLLPPGSKFVVQSVDKSDYSQTKISILLVDQDSSPKEESPEILESNVESTSKTYSSPEDLVADSEAILAKIEELTDPSKSKVENGNIPMRALLELMGKGGKPQVVSAIEELDGGDILYRGTTDENAENFINGDSDRIGLGHNGDGYYFTNMGRTAVEYAGEGSLLRGGWKRDAKVQRFTNPETALEDYKVASSEVSNKWAKKLKMLDGEPSEAEQEIFDNYAFYDVDAYITDLILQGFDGVEIAQPYGDEVFVIVFNREALKIVDQ